MQTPKGCSARTCTDHRTGRLRFRSPAAHRQYGTRPIVRERLRAWRRRLFNASVVPVQHHDRWRVVGRQILQVPQRLVQRCVPVEDGQSAAARPDAVAVLHRAKEPRHPGTLRATVQVVDGPLVPPAYCRRTR